MEHVREKLSVSERRACRVLGQARSTQRRSAQVPDDEARLVARVTDLVPGRPEGAEETAQARAFMAERRLLCSQASVLSESCVVLRLPGREDARWAAFTDAGCDG